MDTMAVGILTILGVLLLLIIGMPVSFALGLVGLVGLYLCGGGAIAIGAVGSIPYHTVSNFVFVAAPLFILMGEFLLHSGIGREIFDVATNWVGRLRGGLAMSSVGASAIFGACCGVSIAGAAAIGVVAIPEMKKHGYGDALATGTVAAAGALAILIPPSMTMIVYGAVTEISVGRLFIAGIIPGIMLASLFMLFIWSGIKLGLVHAPPPMAVSWKQSFLSLRKLWTIIFLVAMIMGGIYGGVVTASEAAAAGAIGALFLAGVVYRSLNWHSIKAALTEATKVNCMVLLIVSCAMIFGYFMTIVRVPQVLCDFAVSLPVSRYVILAAINFLLIFMGCFLDIISVILISVPIVFPIILALEFNPLWFGIIMTINLEMAVITPPVGLNLYVIKGIAKDVPLANIIRGALPFVAMEALAIVLVTMFPQLALFLPSLMK